MELPKINGGMFDGLKSKLGLGGQKEEIDDFDEYDDYDNIDDYDDDEYRDDYQDFRDDYGTYDDYESSRGRRSVAAENRETYESALSNRAGVTRPRLVSIDDVRASTQLDIEPDTSREQAYGTSRYQSESVPSFADNLDEEMPEWQPRSEGLDSLFSPTTPASSAAPAAGRLGSSPLQQRSSLFATQATPRTEPAPQHTVYEERPAEQRPTYSTKRALSVIKPFAYGDVERVAGMVRQGDAVILSMAATPEALSKRILDFSFGVASALNARVDCLADKTFVIATGGALNANELQELKSRGIL